MILEGKVTLITGAGAGIGAVIARLFAQEGASVCAPDVDGPAAAATASAIPENGGVAIAVEADLRHAGQTRAAVETAASRFGRVDVLVNSAAMYPRQSFLAITEQQWDDMLDVNLKAAFLCAQFALPLMIERRAGKIVNISSATFHIGM